MSNTLNHPAVEAAASFGAEHANAVNARKVAGTVTEGWTSAKLRCAVQFGVNCAIDPDAIALAADVANAFTHAATGKRLEGDSLSSQARKFVAFGKLGRDAEALVANIRRVVDTMGATANSKTSDKDDKAAAKRANIRVFEKAVTLARLACKLNTVNLAEGDIVAKLTESEGDPLAQALAAAVAALQKAKALDSEAGWVDFLPEIEAAADIAKAAASEAKAKAEKDREALERSELVAEAKAARLAKAAAKAAPAPVEITEDEMLGGLLTA